jgi:hypothetical protein
MRTQNGESEARYIYGSENAHTDDNDFNTHTLSWKERSLQSYQLNGKHYLPGFMNSATFSWNGSYTYNRQDEPNLRRFTYESGVNFDGDSIYQIRPSGYRGPTRIYRKIEADSKAFDAKMEIPFKSFSDLKGKLTFGGAYSRRDREFRKDEFLFMTTSYYRFNGDPQEFFEDSETGLVDSSENNDGTWRYKYGRFFHNAAVENDQYDATEEIGAYFWMLDFPLSSRLKAVGGFRLETTDMLVETLSGNEAEVGKI